MMLEIFLGTNERGEEVSWKPKEEKNPHFLVVGTSGSGKTETLKAMIHELSEQGVPSLIIDFHQDFEELADDVLDFNSVTINPLEFSPETPESVMYKVSHILKKIFALGVQQEGLLQDAILTAYRDKGVDIKSTQTKEAPTFEDVKDTLESMMERLREERRPTQTVETLLVRLRPLFNTGFFTQKKSTVPFKKIFSETTVLKLKNMPTEEVKYAIAEFFINKLKYELYARGKTDKIVLYCVVDEAHRLIDERSPLNDLLRESRKYGTGVILSSQRPSDFSDTVLANVGGIMALQCRLEKDAIFVSKQMGVDFEKIKNLTEVGMGYLNLSSREGTELVRVKPLWKRKKTKEKKEKKREETVRVTDEQEETVRVTDEYRIFPPILWLERGAKIVFSDFKTGAACAIVLGGAFAFLPTQQSLIVTLAAVAIAMIIGRNNSKEH